MKIKLILIIYLAISTNVLCERPRRSPPPSPSSPLDLSIRKKNVNFSPISSDEEDETIVSPMQNQPEELWQAPGSSSQPHNPVPLSTLGRRGLLNSGNSQGAGVHHDSNRWHAFGMGGVSTNNKVNEPLKSVESEQERVGNQGAGSKSHHPVPLNKEDQNASPKPKRMKFTEKQQSKLNELYKKTKYPTNEQLKEVAAGIGLNLKQACNWFGRRRSTDNEVEKKARGRPPFSQDIKVILDEHIADDILSKEKKKELAQKTGLTMLQVQNYFTHHGSNSLKRKLEKEMGCEKRTYIKKPKMNNVVNDDGSDYDHSPRDN